MKYSICFLKKVIVVVRYLHSRIKMGVTQHNPFCKIMILILLQVPCQVAAVCFCINLFLTNKELNSLPKKAALFMSIMASHFRQTGCYWKRQWSCSLVCIPQASRGWSSTSFNLSKLNTISNCLGCLFILYNCRQRFYIVNHFVFIENMTHQCSSHGRS